ncbi:MAG: DUF3791 domain-containing protein [Prevotellaceae bacterium]|jgi:hypothetical protein|nr:DUF3791 domain-containing protein [Prevotellaceae bacterium]
MNSKKLEKAADVIDYIAFMINDFAEKHNLSMRQSFDYLYKYGGLAFLDRHYAVEHVENPLITLDSLQRICEREGGNL